MQLRESGRSSEFPQEHETIGPDALFEVEKELDVVSELICEQMKKLEQTKQKLAIIDNESNALEIEYTNLNDIQKLLNQVLVNISLSETDVKVLTEPHLLLDDIVQSPPKTFKKKLNQLLETSNKLYNALEYTTI